MEIKRLRVLAFEIFKTVNNLSPNYMKIIFTPKLHPKVRPNDISVKHHNAITYDARSLKTLSPKIWNQLPGDIKSETSFTKLKEYIDTWLGNKCRCNVYMNIFSLRCLLTLARGLSYILCFYWCFTSNLIRLMLRFLLL